MVTKQMIAYFQDSTHTPETCKQNPRLSLQLPSQRSATSRQKTTQKEKKTILTTCKSTHRVLQLNNRVNTYMRSAQILDFCDFRVV